METHYIILLVSEIMIVVLYGSCQMEIPGNLGLLRKQRALSFPEGSVQGLVLATSVPLSMAGDVSVAWFLEADYGLPDNFTELALPIISVDSGRRSRNLNRNRVYDMIQIMLSRYGFNGRECLLKAICETSKYPVHHNHHNGLLGQLIYIIFTPSSSLNEDLDPDFDKAEHHGTSGDDCSNLYFKCSLSLHEYFTVLED